MNLNLALQAHLVKSQVTKITRDLKEVERKHDTVPLIAVLLAIGLIKAVYSLYFLSLSLTRKIESYS